MFVLPIFVGCVILMDRWLRTFFVVSDNVGCHSVRGCDMCHFSLSLGSCKCYISLIRFVQAARYKYSLLNYSCNMYIPHRLVLCCGVITFSWISTSCKKVWNLWELARSKRSSRWNDIVSVFAPSPILTSSSESIIKWNSQFSRQQSTWLGHFFFLFRLLIVSPYKYIWYIDDTTIPN